MKPCVNTSVDIVAVQKTPYYKTGHQTVDPKSQMKFMFKKSSNKVRNEYCPIHRNYRVTVVVKPFQRPMKWLEYLLTIG